LLDVAFQEIGQPAALKRGSVLVLPVIDIVDSYRDEVVSDELEELRVSPDELPGLDSVLSAAAARVAEVHPEQERFVLPLRLDQALKDAGLPIDLLEREIPLAWRRIGADGGEGALIEFRRRGTGLGRDQEREAENHAPIMGRLRAAHDVVRGSGVRNAQAERWSR